MSVTYEHVLKNGNKVQVDSAVRDDEGVKISTNYAKKNSVVDLLTDQSIDGQKVFEKLPKTYKIVHKGKHNLPPEYQELEYLEANNKLQYIPLVQFNSASEDAEIIFSPTDVRGTGTSNYPIAWGKNSNFQMGFNLSGWNIGNAVSTKPYMPEKDVIYVGRCEAGKFLIKKYGIEDDFNNTGLTRTINDIPCAMGDGSYENICVRIYEIKHILRSTDAILNCFVPAKELTTSRVGLYDTVTGLFYIGTAMPIPGPNDISGEIVKVPVDILVSDDLATVAFTGSYDNLLDTPNIPSVYNGTLTIKRNNTSIGTFTANSSSSPSVNITVPTTVAELDDKDDYATVEYVDDEIQDVREVAEGKTATYVCSSETNPILNSLDDAITITSTLTDINGNILQLDVFRIGDNIYIPETNVPDRWVMDTSTNSIIVSRLETAKVAVNDVQVNDVSVVNNSIANITGLADDTEVVHNTGNEVINGQKDFNTVPRLWISREEEIIVPEGYTQLEYISADGNEYVSTGIIGNLNTKFKLIAAPATHSTVIFGSRSSATSNNVSCLVGPTNDNVVDFGNYNITRAVATISNSIYVKIEYYNSKDRRYMKNVATDIILAENTTPFTTQITTPTELYFGYYGAGTFPSGDTNFIGYYYSCEIYDDETLIANFVPAKENATGKVGFYDTIRNIFLSSIGPSEYIAGPTIESRYENLLTNGNFSTVAFTGDYFDLANKPTIPTSTSQLTNNSGFQNATQVNTLIEQYMQSHYDNGDTEEF